MQSEVEILIKQYSFWNSIVKSKLSANCIAGHDLITFGVVTQMEPYLYPWNVMEIQMRLLKAERVFPVAILRVSIIVIIVLPDSLQCRCKTS